jgi:hypothetical protein
MAWHAQSKQTDCYTHVRKLSRQARDSFCCSEEYVRAACFLKVNSFFFFKKGPLIGNTFSSRTLPFLKITTQIKSNIIYFNCARATLICFFLNKHKQNGSHNTPLRELGRDQFSQLVRVLRPKLRLMFTFLSGLAMLLLLCIDWSAKSTQHHLLS